MLTDIHTLYYAWELSHRKSVSDDSRFSRVLSEAKVDLNPHQVEAALFAFKSPLSKGAILADEVGLGKTIEAGIILSELWAEHCRKIIIIVPASLRTQWNVELYEKFYIPSVILDGAKFKALKQQQKNPFDVEDSIIICSYQFAASNYVALSRVKWDLVVFDEAHKLRNVYKKENITANILKDSLKGYKKLLLTATPLQNNLKELYGLISIIDDQFFSSEKTFEDQYNAVTTRDKSTFGDLKYRISHVVHRTLRRQVTEYVKFTKRNPFVQQYVPIVLEQQLYAAVSNYLLREGTYGIPDKIKPLMTMLIWKIMSSSAYALKFTLGKIIDRLETLKSTGAESSNLMSVFSDYEVSDDAEQEWVDQPALLSNIDIQFIDEEINELRRCQEIAENITDESKALKLVDGLTIAFKQMEDIGAQKKALIFTESRKTQEYLKAYLESHGYEKKVVCFNGSNNDAEANRIYKLWLHKYAGSSRESGNVLIDRKQALVDAFATDAEIMIATEAGAEGINLQFCSLVVNYDMPWNPQRVEQRIGRCHRYGQKHDVVVMNFVNELNAADCRVYTLLSSKFNLFDGVFGSSDEVLGAVDAVDFEKRILNIYRTCRTEDEINQEFDQLQKELDQVISERIKQTKKTLLENFDEDVIKKLKNEYDADNNQINWFTSRFWKLALTALDDCIDHVNEDELSFHLVNPPINGITLGDYTLNKYDQNKNALRLTSELGQYIIDKCLAVKPRNCRLTFDLSNYRFRSKLLEEYKEQSGWLAAYRIMSSNQYDGEETVIFCPVTKDGTILPSEFGLRLMELQVIDEGEMQLDKKLECIIKNDFEQKKKKYLEDVESKTSEYANYEIEKFESWSDDRLVPLQNEVIEIRKEHDAIHREIRKERDVKAKLVLKRKELVLGNKLREKQQALFALEDDYRKQVDEMTNRLLKTLEHNYEDELMFQIEWKIK